MLCEPEVVVRRERHDLATVVERERRSGPVERADRAPATGIGHDAVAALDPLGPRHVHTSSMASRTVVTMRSISSAVMVSGGISTTMSPSGRINTPLRTHAAD